MILELSTCLCLPPRLLHTKDSSDFIGHIPLCFLRVPILGMKVLWSNMLKVVRKLNYEISMKIVV